MSFHLENTTVKTLSIKMALEFLEFNDFEGQRPIAEPHMKFLEDEHRHGRYRMGAIAFAQYKEKMYLVNGQHTLRLIERLGVSLKCSIEWYRCDCKDDVRILFSTFDKHKRRSARDGHRMAREFTYPGEICSISLQALVRAGKALVIFENYPDLTFMPSSENEQIRLNKKYPKLVEFVSQFQRERLARKLGVVVAMVGTYKASQDRAATFWTRVVGGEGLIKSDPEYKLRQVLINGLTKLSSHSYGAPQNREYYARSISWWNTFCSGTRKGSIKYNPNWALPRISGLKQ